MEKQGMDEAKALQRQAAAEYHSPQKREHFKASIRYLLRSIYRNGP
jgi:hypothetical protein